MPSTVEPATRPSLDRSSLRARLSETIAAAAGPYGYTISLGGSIALATERLGSPHLTGALLLMLGAVAAFAALGIGAQGASGAGQPPGSGPPSVWANAHVPSAGLALCAVWGIDHVVDGALGWLLTGFAATGIYLAVCAVQQVAAAAIQHRHRPSPEET